MLEHYKEFGNKHIIMIIYILLSEVVKFANDFSIANYPHIRIGTEGDSFSVMRFYKVLKFQCRGHLNGSLAHKIIAASLPR